MSSLPNPQPQQPPPRQPLNIQRRPSRRNQDANPPKPPCRSSSFSFSNRTSFSSIDSAIHTQRDSTSKSKSRSNSSGGGGGGGTHNPATTTTAPSNLPPEQPTFTCTFCWRPYPSSDRHIFHRSTSNGRSSWKKAPRPACPPCYRAIIDLSIYWVCGEVVLRGEECVSLGWCFWHRACYGCLLCGSKRVVRPPGVGVGEVFEDGDAKVENDGGKGENERDRERGREMEKEKERERKMLGRKRGREIDQVPLCKECLAEVEGKEGLGDGDEEEREKVVVKKGLERIDRVDGGLTRRRWEMREGDKEKEREKEEKKIGDGGKGGLLPLRRGAVDNRSVTGNRSRDEMASSSGSVKPETIYVNIFDPVGREAFRPSLMKSIPEWMRSGAREHIDRKTESPSAVNSGHDRPREQMNDHTSTISTPRPISQALSETSSTATVIQTPPQPIASRASTRRRSGAISPRATSPVPSIDAISRPSSVLGRRTPNLRTGTSFVSEQPLVVPSMSSNHPKETTKVSAKDSSRDSWLSTDSNVSSNPITSSYNNQSETLSRPSSVRSVATIFERGIASKDQRHTPVNQPLPLLRVLQQPYRPLTPTRSDTSLSSSSPHLQPNLTTRPQRAQTHELGAASLPKPIQILRSGQARQSSMNRMGSATVSIPVVSTSSEYLERYQPVKASTSSSFLSSSSPGGRSSVRSSIRAGGQGVSAITRGWEGQLSNTSSSGETERDLLANRFSVYSTSQPPSSFLQASYPGAEAQRTSIRRSVSHSIRREGALDEGVGVGVGGGQSSPAGAYPNVNGQTTIRRSISHSIRREGAHDQSQGHHSPQFQSQSHPQSPTLPSRSLPYSPPNSPPSSPPNGPNGPTARIPLNFTVQRRFVKRPSIKGGPTIGGSAVTAASTSTSTAGTEGQGHMPSTPASSTWASSSESSPGTGTGTGEEKGGGSGLRPAWTRTRTPSVGNATSGTGTPVMPAPVKTLSKRRSVHAELKRLFGRQ